MEITFLIGNGFDIQCGLNSGYRDVYKEYQCNAIFNKNAEILCKHFNSDSGENWSNFEIGIVENANKFSNLQELIECVEDFRLYTSNYIKKEDLRVYELLNKEDNYSLIREETIKSLNSFWIKLAPNDCGFIRNYIGFRTKCNLISLNYTIETPKLILNKSIQGEYMSQRFIGPFIPGEFVRVHGDYFDGLVMAADNSKQFIDKNIHLTNEESIMLTKEGFIKEYDVSRVNKAIDILDKTDVLVIYGASLDESDDSWRKRIVSWLFDKENRHLIRIYKYEDSICPKSDTKMVLAENEKKRKLAEELNIKDENLSKCINRIHIPLGNNLFNYRKIIE